MIRILSFIAVLFLACAPAQAATPVTPDAPASTTQPETTGCSFASETGDTQSYMPFPAQLKHGINLSRWWDDDAQGATVTPEDIRQIHTMGFDYVRLPISPSWLEMKDTDARKKKLEQLRCDIISLLNQNLTVIVDLHPSDAFQADMMQRPDDIVRRIERDWSQIQPILEGLPTWRIYLELCSEPMIDSVQWWRLQGQIIDDLRSALPNYTFIASPGPFDGWWDLVDRTPYKDLNVIYGFYFYEPAFFTHHGQEADLDASRQPPLEQTPKTPESIVYPVDKVFNFDLKDPDTAKYVNQGWNRGALRIVAQNITSWRDHFNVGIVCLEFGVYKAHVDERSRYNWLQDVHKTLDDLNVPWTLWEYRGPYGLVDQHGVPDKGTMEALVLKESEGK